MLTQACIQKIESFTAAGIESKRAVGLAVGVIEADALVYCTGFGVRKLGDASPVTEHTLFHTASVTKPFVATAIMQLVEQHKLRLDMPVYEALPYFALADARYKQITLKHLLTHTSGLPNSDTEDQAFTFAFEHPEYDADAPARHVRELASTGLVSTPGERYGYSNFGYHILGEVIRTASGMVFADYIKLHVLDPIDMTSSMFDPRYISPPLATAGHIGGDPDNIAHVSPVYPYHRAFEPSSSLHSSVFELCRWAQLQLNRGELDGQRLLSLSSMDAMWQRYTPLVADNPQAGFRGLSWYLYDQYDRRVIAHHGGDVGFASLFQFFPDDHAAVVVLANTDWGVFDPGPIADIVCESWFVNSLART